MHYPTWYSSPTFKETKMAGFLPEPISGCTINDERRWKHLVVPPVVLPEKLKSGGWNTRRSFARIYVEFSEDTVSITFGYNNINSQSFYKQDVQELIAFLQEVEKQL